MIRVKLPASLATAAVLSATPTAYAAQAAPSNFPSKPITLLVGFAAGGSVDNAARRVAQGLQAAGWNVVVENRVGASGLIAARELARSAPDGYTLMMGSVSNLAMVPVASSNPQFDPLKDVTPVAKIGSAPLMMLVQKNSPLRTVKDLIDTAKSSSKSLNYASGGIATPPHLAGELFASTAGIKVNHIPYRGEAPALVDLIGNHVPMMFANLTTAMPHVQAGAVHAVAVSSLERTPTAPNVPTLAESGLPGFEVENWFGIVAPAATPTAIVERIHNAVAKALKSEDLRKHLSEQGLRVEDVSVKQFGEQMRSEVQKWSKVIMNVNIRLD